MKKLLAILVLGLLWCNVGFAAKNKVSKFKEVLEYGDKYIITKEKREYYFNWAIPTKKGLDVAEDYCRSKGLVSFYIIAAVKRDSSTMEEHFFQYLKDADKHAVQTGGYTKKINKYLKKNPQIFLWPDIMVSGFGLSRPYRYFCAKNRDQALSYFKSKIPGHYGSQINASQYSAWTLYPSDIAEYIVESGNPEFTVEKELAEEKRIAEEKKKVEEKRIAEEKKSREKSNVVQQTKLLKEAWRCFKKKDYKCSLKKFEQESKQSENKFTQMESKHWLSYHYNFGLGVELDEVKAVKLMEEVYNSGNEKQKRGSLPSLIYNTFTRVPGIIDGKKQIKYNEENIDLILNGPKKYKEKQKDSLGPSYTNAAFIYLLGIDVKKDLNKAFEYYKKSDSPNAYNTVALFYLLGLGPVDVSKEEAIKYYKKTLDLMDEKHGEKSQKKSQEEYIKKLDKIDKKKGWMGINFDKLRISASKAFNYPNKYGAYVGSVRKGSPADKSGIEMGDIIVKHDDRKTFGHFILTEYLRTRKPGDKIKFLIWRKQNLIKKEVTLGSFSEMVITKPYDYKNNVRYVIAKSLINLLESYDRVPADYLELTDWIKSDMKNYPELIVLLVDVYRNYDHMQSYVWSKIALDSYAELNLDKRNEKVNKESLYEYIIVLEAIFLDKNEVDKALKIAARKKDVLLAEIEGAGKVIVSSKKPVKTDIEGPIIQVKSEIVSKSPEYTIKGKVKDKASEVMTLHVNGEPISIDRSGKFIITRFNPSGETLEIKAWDEWANSTVVSVKVIVEEQSMTEVKDVFEVLKLPARRAKQDDNKVAIVIGIENYDIAPKASYANRDAEFFTEYLKRMFGVPKQNLIILRDEEAKLIKFFSILEKWLPGVAGSGGKDIYVFYAGHGLSSNDGKELYLLTHDSDPDLLKRTAIMRSDLFSLINDQKPKSVTIFFDTCYSGPSRDGEMLIASARPIRIVAEDEDNIPSNFSVFSAAKNDQISSSISEIKHGIFSYYLMKGLEGESDSNKDRKITNQEMIDYLNLNVKKIAAKAGRKQNPVLSGDPDQVLVRY